MHIARYVPQRALLDRCAAVVCHGGYDTVLDAIDAGVPLVVVPFGADQHINGKSVERLDIERLIDGDNLTPASVQEAVLELIREPRWRENVLRVRDAWRALPGPETAVGVVEAAVAGNRSIDQATQSGIT